MSRGDGLQGEYRFSDGDDEAEDLGYGGGGRQKYDDDDEDEGGWATHRETDDLWDSTEDLDEDEEAVEGGAPEMSEGEEEEDAFGRAPMRAPKAPKPPKPMASAPAPKPAAKKVKPAKRAKPAKKAAKKAAKKPAKKAAKKSAKKGKKKGRR